MLRIMVVLLSLFLSGCGTYYNVSVSSLVAEPPLPEVSPCYLESAMSEVGENDLLFQEVGRMVEYAIAFQGMSATKDRNAAKGLVRISYSEGAPIVTLEETTVQRQKPVILRDGKKQRVEYVTVEESSLSTNTSYNVKLLIEAYVKQDNGKPGQQIWKTTVTCSGPDNDMRTLLNKTGPVLPQVLGVRSQGVRNFEVFVEDNGSISVSEQSNNGWW